MCKLRRITRKLSKTLNDSDGKTNIIEHQQTAFQWADLGQHFAQICRTESVSKLKDRYSSQNLPKSTKFNFSYPI